MTTLILVLLAVLSIIVLAFIVFAPWKTVREEPKLDEATQTKLLLHRNPDEPTGEIQAITPVSGFDDETDPHASYEDLSHLDDEGRPKNDG